MIYDNFRATGAYDAAQDPSNLFHVSLHDDDIQDFDTRLDQALLAASETSTEMVLEGSNKSKLQDSVQLQTVLDMSSTVRKRGSIQNKKKPCNNGKFWWRTASTKGEVR